MKKFIFFGIHPLTSDSSDQTYSSDSGFSALEFDKPDSEMSDCIYREAVGDSGDMFEPCEDCGALKLKPNTKPKMDENTQEEN